MLDVIADFWKPAKKVQSQEKLQPELLQLGSSLGFGFVPQAILSGRRLHVSAINTYQFGDEALTSFVLTQDKDAANAAQGVSMIVAESEGEYYLAISRRISLNDRMRLFDGAELEGVMSKGELTKLICRDNIADFKGWVVASYKREIQGLRGSLLKGDFRKIPATFPRDGQEFEYTLLVSDSNEHAIEIEKYADGRVEVYATVYRRLNDVGEITHPTLSAEMIRPDIKLASAPELLAKEPVAVSTSPVISAANHNGNGKIESALADESAHPAPIKLQEFAAPAVIPVEAAVIEAKTEEKSISKETPSSPVQAEPAPPATIQPPINGAKNDMSTAEALRPKLYVQATAPDTFNQQEVKAVTNKALNGFESDAIECDLRVANKIIDEAIRNEMRLTDIVRRIIELPVAYPESVQIPVTLTDEDYALLAIRYGIPAADRNSIKRRIIEDLNDFSGGKKKAA